MNLRPNAQHVKNESFEHGNNLDSPSIIESQQRTIDSLLQRVALLEAENDELRGNAVAGEDGEKITRNVWDQNEVPGGPSKTSQPRHVTKYKGNLLQSRELSTESALQSNRDSEEFISPSQWHRFRRRSNIYFDGHQSKFGLEKLPNNFQRKKIDQSRPREMCSSLPAQATSYDQSSFRSSEPNISRPPIDWPFTLDSNGVAPKVHRRTRTATSTTPAPRRRSILYFDPYRSSFGKSRDFLSLSCRDVDDTVSVATFDKNTENSNDHDLGQIKPNEETGIVDAVHLPEFKPTTQRASEASEGEELEEKLNVFLRQTFGPQSESSLDSSINYDYFESANEDERHSTGLKNSTTSFNGAETPCVASDSQSATETKEERAVKSEDYQDEERIAIDADFVLEENLSTFCDNGIGDHDNHPSDSASDDELERYVEREFGQGGIRVFSSNSTAPCMSDDFNNKASDALTVEFPQNRKNNGERQIEARFKTKGESNQTGDESHYEAFDISKNELHGAGDITVTVPTLKPLCERTRSKPYSSAKSPRNRNKSNNESSITSANIRSCESEHTEVYGHCSSKSSVNDVGCDIKASLEQSRDRGKEIVENSCSDDSNIETGAFRNKASEYSISNLKFPPEDATEEEIDAFLEKRFSMVGKCITENISKQTDGARVFEVSKTNSSPIPFGQGSLIYPLRSQTGRCGNADSSNEGSICGKEEKTSKLQNQVGKGGPCRDSQMSQHFMRKSASKILNKKVDTIESKRVSFTLGKKKTNRYMTDLNPVHRSLPDQNKQGTMSNMPIQTAVYADSQEEEGAPSFFRDFVLFSKKTDSIGDQVNGGDRFFDPFVFRNVDCIDKYPTEFSRDSFNPEHIASFCCPEGISIRIFPRVGMARARRMGWMGKMQYKLLAFTNVKGTITHGIAITTSEEISSQSPDTVSFLQELQHLREKRLSSRKIKLWWRSLRKKRSKQSGRKHDFGRRTRGSSNEIMFRNTLQSLFRSNASVSGLSLDDLKDDFSASDGRLKEKAKIFGRSSLFKRSISESELVFDEISDDGSTQSEDRLSFRRRGSSSEFHELKIFDEDSDHGSVQSMGFLDWSGRLLDELNVCEKARILGREAFEAMNEVTAMGDVCVVEKCYVLIGGNQSDQWLQFRLLQNMIEMEQKKNEPSGDSSIQFSTLHGEYNDSEMNELTLFRRRYLQAIQLETIPQPHNKLTQQETEFVINLPAFASKNASINVHSPISQVAAHWGVSALFTRIKYDDLLICLKCLIIERSVLVLGESSDLVTSCTCALLDLLKPYTWASNFIPLLPSYMIDFVNSPVPFIIGMTINDDDRGISIQSDHRVASAIADGLSVINLTNNSVILTTQTGIVELLNGCPTPKPQLSKYQRQLKQLHASSSGLQEFSRFIDHGLSKQELGVIESIRAVIRTYLTGLADNIGSDPDAWQLYGVQKSDDEHFDFYPSFFVDGLKQQFKLLECRLKFQEMMAYSQMFVEFVDSRRKASLAKNTKEYQ